MNREIKFCVWDIVNKKMYYDDLVVLTSDRLNEGIKELQENHQILMQFTGLKDKNGKEIYEKNIIEYKNEIGETIIDIIEWSNSCSGWFAKRGGRLADLIHYQTVIREKQFGEKSYPKIIGNIFENSNLI